MKAGRKALWFAGIASALLIAGCQGPEPKTNSEDSNPPVAELILQDGNVITLDDEFGNVSALALADGRIIAVGSDAEIAVYRDAATEIIELEGKTVVPGFVEGHAHFVGIGQASQVLDLRAVESWEEVVAMVEAAVAEADSGEWILGRGWHQEKWKKAPATGVKGFPTHASISSVSPENPVCLRHASGHACFFNQRAMELADVDAGTADPPGGELLRDSGGNPTGVFLETAAGLVEQARYAELGLRSPTQVEADLRRSIKLADRECVSKGITSFQDAGSPLETIDILKKMADEGELMTRLYVMISEPNDRLARSLADYRVIGMADNHLTVRAIKRSIDGALGSRGAWLLEAYSDEPSSKGLATLSVDYLAETARLAAQYDYQLCVHAIGDRANREVLDLYEGAFETREQLARSRWRIEHAQHLHPDDIPRFGELGVIASMQGIHCTSDAPWVVPRLGERRSREGAYVWRKLIDSGALVTNGTDAPVEDVDPIASYSASVTRRTGDGELFYPDQAMSRIEALQSYTVNAATAAFEENLKGTLTPGKLADLVVLSKDITTVPGEKISECEVLLTIIGGVVVYLKSSEQNAENPG